MTAASAVRGSTRRRSLSHVASASCTARNRRSTVSSNEASLEPPVRPGFVEPKLQNVIGPPEAQHGRRLSRLVHGSRREPQSRILMGLCGVRHIPRPHDLQCATGAAASIVPRMERQSDSRSHEHASVMMTIVSHQPTMAVVFAAIIPLTSVCFRPARGKADTNPSPSMIGRHELADRPRLASRYRARNGLADA